MKKAVFGILLMSMSANADRIVEDFNKGWKFHLGDVPEAAKAGFDDAQWRPVRLPHDWSVELSFTTNEAEGCTAWLPGGIGWYRKTFTVPAAYRGRTVRIDFDGVYNNSDVWINGAHLGHRPYGYVPFSYDLTEHLHYGGENTIVVKADRSRYMDCRWYPGSGIYRDVRLVAHNPVHLAQYGVFVTTEKNRRVIVRTSVVNGSRVSRWVAVKTDLQEADGKSVGFQILEFMLEAGGTEEVRQVFELKDPKLWDPEHPYLYTAQVEADLDGRTVDSETVPFGVRSLCYDPQHGFFLNGKQTLLKGVCLHHDGGCVGAAVPDGVWERRLRLLKAGGCNAIRTAHNPPSAAFLNLCDRLGFLVQDEAFDEWFNPKDKKHNFELQEADPRTLGYSESFGAWAERDIKQMVLRDRNHPCIIMWSIGNEIEWTYPGYSDATGYWSPETKGTVNYYWDEPPYSLEELKRRFAESKVRQGRFVLANQASDLSRWIKELDTSRPVTANLVMPSVSHFSGYADALDIVGYSYRAVNYEWGHKHFPEKMILGTENWVQWSEWKAVLDHPFIPGIFMWTGINYLGESNNWPQKTNGSGMINIAGFPKANYWFFKSLWTDGPMVHIAAQPLAESNYLLQDGKIVENPERPRTRKWGWPKLSSHWNYEAGEPVYIELYSNCEETELFLNGKSLGTRRLANCPDRLMKWVVPFEPGTLKAVARNDGKEAAFQTLETADGPAALQLTADKTELAADGYDVAHCVVQLVDAAGVPVKHINRMVRFTVEGDARNIGVDNGSSHSTQDFQAESCETDQGRCLMILQAGEHAGPVKVTASVEGLKPVVIDLNVK